MNAPTCSKGLTDVVLSVTTRTRSATRGNPSSVPFLQTPLRLRLSSDKCSSPTLQADTQSLLTKYAFDLHALSLSRSPVNEKAVMLHSQTLKMSQLLSLKFAFPSPGHRQQTSALPEIQLMCALIVAVKLYHPFDGLTRHVRSLADPAALTIDWAVWVDVQSSHSVHTSDESHLERGSEIKVSEKDVMNMTGKEMDEYMDWHERTFVDEVRAGEKARGLPQQLLDMFPTGRTDGSSPTPYDYKQAAAEEQETIDKKLKLVMGKLRLRDVVSDDSEESDRVREDSTPVGSFYKRYKKVEDLPPHAKVFHEAAAEMVAVKLETLILGVGQVERKLIKYREAKVKAGKEEGHAARENKSDKDDGPSMKQ